MTMMLTPAFKRKSRWKYVYLLLIAGLLWNAVIPPSVAWGEENTDYNKPVYAGGLRIQSSLPGAFNSIRADRSGDFVLTARLPEQAGSAGPADSELFGPGAVKDETRGQNGYLIKSRENAATNKLEPLWVQGLYEIPDNAQSYVGYYHVHFNDAVQLKNGTYAVVGYGSPSSVYYSVYAEQNIRLRDLQGYEFTARHKHDYSAASNDDAMIVQIDGSGLVRKVAVRDGSGSARFTSVAAASDGGFVAAGSSPLGPLLVKYDGNGVQQWESSLYEGEAFRAVAELPDGGYAAVGRSGNSQNGVHGFIAKFSAEGSLIWVVNADETSELNDVIVSLDGEIVVAGNKGGTLVMAKYDNAGQRIAETSLTGGGQSGDFLASVTRASNGGFVFAGVVQSSQSNSLGNPAAGGEAKGGKDWIIIKTDENLNKEWHMFAGGAEQETGGLNAAESGPGHMLAMNDTSIALAGASASVDGNMSALKPPFGGQTNAAAVSFTLDWDRDGVINARDFYPQDSSRVLPSGTDMNLIKYDKEASVTFSTYKIGLQQLHPYTALDNLTIPSGQDAFTAPAVVFANMMRGGYEFAFHSESAPSEFVLAMGSIWRPETRRALRVVKQSADLSGYSLSGFGAYVQVALSLPEGTNTDQTGIYAVSSDFTRLSPIQQVSYSEGQASFVVGQLGTYLVDQLISPEYAALDKAIAAIMQLPLPDGVALSDKANIQAARAAYEGLSAADKERLLPGRLLFLADVEGKLEELTAEDQQKRLEQVIVLIEALPTAVSLGNKDKVSEAREAYNALEASWRSQVPAALVTKLINAESTIAGYNSIVNTTPPSVTFQSSSYTPALPAGLYQLTTVQLLTPKGNVAINPEEYGYYGIAYDPSIVPQGYTVDIYYYDAKKKEWIPSGGKAENGMVHGLVKLMAPYAVFAKLEVKSAEPYDPQDLKDIAGHWAEEDIRGLIAQGVITGYADGTFWPDWIITRAEFVAMLVRSMRLQNAAESDFSDTAEHWAAEAIRIAVHNGVVSGYSDGTFKPDQPITREEMAVLLIKALQAGREEALEQPDVSEITFSDANAVADWAVPAVRELAARGIMEGAPGNLFLPGSWTTRAEAATVLARATKR